MSRNQLAPTNQPAPTNLTYDYRTIYSGADVGLLIDLRRENDVLRFQLDQKLQKEAAFSAVYDNGTGDVTSLPSGRGKCFTDFTFSSVQLVFSDPHYQKERTFRVTIRRGDSADFTESEVLNNHNFLNLLRLRLGVKIDLYGSESKIADLLRKALFQLQRPAFAHYFGGWINFNIGWRFRVFPGFRTCGDITQFPEYYEALPDVPPASALVAAEQVEQEFSVISNPSLRRSLNLIMHAAFLSTPLDDFGFPLRCGISLNTQTVSAQRVLEGLLTFGEDIPLTLDAPGEQLTSQLIARKDRTTLIRDGRSAGSAAKNTALLGEAIRTGALYEVNKEHRGERNPVHTLPIMICGEDGPLFPCPELIPVQVSAADLDKDVCQQSLRHGSFRSEYWAAFAAFAGENMSLLRNLIESSLISACDRTDESGFSLELVNFFGILCGLDQFLARFRASLSMPASDDAGTDWQDDLFRMLEESTLQTEPPNGLAEVFLAAARQQILDKRLVFHPHNQRADDDDQRPVLYYSGEYFCFNRVAFDQICRDALCSTTAVKRDLQEKGCLVGKRVNGQSFMTRIPAYNGAGIPAYIRVYQMPRKLFEAIGEPPLL